MAFEYSSQGQGLAITNPLKAHNIAMAAASFIIMIAAGALLISSRNLISSGTSPAPYIAIVISVAMVGTSIRYIYSCLSHLRFFFGRGRPMSLAPTLQSEEQGTSAEAEHRIKEALRQQAIEYREPNGPIAGLLYTIVPNLIFSPPPLRRFAEWQFKGIVTLGALILGLAATLLVGMPGQTAHNSNVADWIGVFFLLLAAWTLIRPGGRATSPSDDTLLSVKWISILVAFAIVGPVIISIIRPALPEVPQFKPYPHVFFFLGAATWVHVMFFVAIVKQLLPAPPTAVSVIQDTWNLSTTPALVVGEFLRAMQESWPEKIPNRRYVRTDPSIDLARDSGAFTGEAVEESQPFPCRINSDKTQLYPSASSELLMILDGFGVLFTACASVATYLATQTLMTDGILPAAMSMYAVLFWALSSYLLNAALRLWLRFDFDSRIYWLEMQGQYVSGRVDQGNVIHGNLRASTSMVQVEGMTFRLWVADVHTVAFGKDAPRYIVAMAGNPDVADSLAGRLKAFATAQAVIAKLGNAANADRMGMNNAMAAQTTSLPTGNGESLKLDVLGAAAAADGRNEIG